jgi:hypothetical protein
METRFDLAPPAKAVDGLLAVPVDLQRIEARLTFDGATASGAADVSVEFVVGPGGGNPVFDLRQTPAEAWLDGAAIPVADLAHHDLGGGPGAEMRVLAHALAAGSTHTLRITYALGPPQASAAGSYLPALAWSAGPRLTFGFGFTDLGPGRYLEAWIPANLVFDAFDLTLEILVQGTSFPHAVITNAQVATLGTNHWSLVFPATTTAFSPLVEVRAADALSTLAGAVTLPVSGTVVQLTLWKLASGPADLATELGHVQSWLAADELECGPYPHGDRFTAFLHQGGMEYDGATTAAPGSLRHEAFHSWWGRGLKPASQPDAWWDEAWTTWQMAGAASTLPFDFGDPPVELRTSNPWARVTPMAAYSAGARFFQGVAAELGAATLRDLMRAFLVERAARPATTADLEAFLVARSGREVLVDAFHRFVYGLPDPAPAPDLWLRDAPGDPGAEASTGRFWDSPDLWIRNADDGGTAHQDPVAGRDNFFHARVRNRGAGAARHFVVAFNVKTFAGVEFTYPADFLPAIAAAAGFELAPGESRIVKARWPAALVPPAGTHACWLASVLARSDHPVAGRHVWEHNNLAQKNLTVVELEAGDWVVVPFVLPNTRPRRRDVVVEVRVPEHPVGLAATLLFRHAPPELSGRHLEEVPAAPAPRAGNSLDCGGGPAHATAPATLITSRTPHLVADRFGGGVELHPEPRADLRAQLVLRPGERRLLGLRLRVTKGAQRGATTLVDVVLRDAVSKAVVGGIAVRVQVR